MAKSDADELIPGGDPIWNASKEKSAKMTTKDLQKWEEQDDAAVQSMSEMVVTKDDKASINEFQKRLFGGDGVEGMIKTGNKGISRRKLYEEMMTTLELNGIPRTRHVDEVIKQSILAILG